MRPAPRARGQVAEILWDAEEEEPCVVIHSRGPGAQTLSAKTVDEAEQLLKRLGFEPRPGVDDGPQPFVLWERSAPNEETPCLEERLLQRIHD